MEKKTKIRQLKKIADCTMMSEIINLNVGGKKFTTSKNTLCSISDTFFTAMLMGGIPTNTDDSGAIFIDRDPKLFSIILNYLRTNKLHNVNDSNIDSLIDEAKFFCIAPLIKRLELRENQSTCGGNIFFESLLKSNQSSSPVKQMISFDRGLAVVFDHLIKFYFFSDTNGWKCDFDFEYPNKTIKLTDLVLESSTNQHFLIAIYTDDVTLWRNYYENNQQNIDDIYYNRQPRINDKTKFTKIGHYDWKNFSIDSMFFMRSQLVTLCKEKGRILIWNNSRMFHQNLNDDDNNGESSSSTTTNSVCMITAFNSYMMDYLFLSSNHGVIYLIDMQKLPYRLRDGELLMNKIYKDPDGEEITTISCFCSYCGRFNKRHDITNSLNDECSRHPLEIAYGTKNGTVCILVQDTRNQDPDLFRTIRVHLSPIWKIILCQDYLLTMCTKLHARTWSLIRFRGTISTQPGLKPKSNFSIRYSNKEQLDNIHDIGPYGHQEGLKQVLVELPYVGCNYINIICASNGRKITTLESVDGRKITAVCGLSIDIRDRVFIFTGHDNGMVQIWDLKPAMKRKTHQKDKIDNRSPSPSSTMEDSDDNDDDDDEDNVRYRIY